MELHHIGIVVRNLADGIEQFRRDHRPAYGTDTMHDPLQQVDACFFKDANGLIFELVAPASPTSPVARAAKSSQNILNHLAYSVDDLAAESERLEQSGAVALGPPVPGVVYGNQQIRFFLTPLGYLIELLERPSFSLQWHQIQTATRGGT